MNNIWQKDSTNQKQDIDMYGGKGGVARYEISQKKAVCRKFYNLLSLKDILPSKIAG
jgi:hypothetical protein